MIIFLSCPKVINMTLNDLEIELFENCQICNITLSVHCKTIE